MDIIIKDRGHGKTTELIRMSAETGIPIVCYTRGTLEAIKLRAKDMNLVIPEPMELTQFRFMRYKPEKVYIDDFDYILDELMGTEVVGVTVTPYK